MKTICVKWTPDITMEQFKNKYRHFRRADIQEKELTKLLASNARKKKAFYTSLTEDKLALSY